MDTIQQHQNENMRENVKSIKKYKKKQQNNQKDKKNWNITRDIESNNSNIK
jgi:hypothetical protein